MIKKIIIQGDDWGYTPETISGIGEAYQFGILTETDIMANLLDPAKRSEYRNKIGRKRVNLVAFLSDKPFLERRKPLLLPDFDRQKY